MATKKSALGRGLGALINDAKYETRPINEAISTGAIAEIDVDKIETNPFQPRKDFDDDALTELSASIKQVGLIQPITVKKLNNGNFQLISGERRTRASKLAGLKKISAFVRDADDQGLLEMALVENIQREDLNSIEIALSYQRLLDECQITQEQLSKRVGKQRTTITNYLRLLKLPAEIQAGVRDGKLSMGHARTLVTLENQNSQLKIYTKILNDGLSVRQTEALVREMNFPVKKAKLNVLKKELPQEYVNLKNSLNSKLKTKVDLKRSENGRGSIIISFNSEVEFNRISKILSGNEQ